MLILMLQNRWSYLTKWLTYNYANFPNLYFTIQLIITNDSNLSYFELIITYGTI